MNELGENEVNPTDTTGNEEVLVDEGDDFGNNFSDASSYSDAVDSNYQNEFYSGIHGMIEQPGDVDKFKLTLLSGVTYNLTTQGFPTQGPDSEYLKLSKLSIYGADNKEVSDVNVNDSVHSYLFIPTTTGIYYFEIRSTSEMNTGGYQLLMSTGSFPDGSIYEMATHELSPNDDRQVYDLQTNNSLDMTISFRSDLLALNPDAISNFDILLYDWFGNIVHTEKENKGLGVVNFNFTSAKPWTNYMLEIKALNENAYGTYSIQRLNAGESLPPIPLNFTGTPSDETLEGNAANNYLDGLGGLDTLLGKAGNDTIESHSSAETIDGGDGINTVSYQYATSSVNVNLSLSGSQNTQGGGMDTLISIANINGSPFNDTLSGDPSANNIQGLVGNDTIQGGLGSDQLDGGEGQDTLSYAESKAGVNVNLTTNELSGGDAAGDNILNFEHVLGSNTQDTITGNSMANRLTGGNGYDTLNGNDGNDTLFGGAGRDILMGGNDKDALSGGAGADRFVFKALDESVVGFSHDVITDFKPAQKDIIDVSGLDAIPGTGNNAFDFIGANAFTKASGEARYVFAGKQTLVQFDYDGDARADMEIALTGNIALSATDFFL